MYQRVGLVLVILSAIFFTSHNARAESSVSPIGYVSGGLVGTVVGLGTGHVLQGRYMERGYVFTLGELAALTLFAYNFCIFSCSESQNLGAAVAIAGFAIFKVWEIGNLWLVPKVALMKPREDEGGLQLAVLPTAPRDLTARGFTLALSKRF